MTNRVLAQYMAKMNKTVENAVRDGVIDSPDDFFASEQWIDFSKKVASTYNNFITNNYDDIYKNGEIDSDVFLKKQIMDDNIRNLNREFSNIFYDTRKKYKRAALKESLIRFKEDVEEKPFGNYWDILRVSKTWDILAK
jgi:hypothetical protein